MWSCDILKPGVCNKMPMQAKGQLIGLSLWRALMCLPTVVWHLGFSERASAHGMGWPDAFGPRPTC